MDECCVSLAPWNGPAGHLHPVCVWKPCLCPAQISCLLSTYIHRHIISEESAALPPNPMAKTYERKHS